MRTLDPIRVLLLGTSLLVSGCGVTYRSPTVQSQAAGFDVQVVALTAQSVKAANRAPYQPMTLPAVFHATAQNPGLRGAGTLPDIPNVPKTTRQSIKTHLPAPVSSPRYKIGRGDVLLLATKGSAKTIEGLSGLLAAQGQRQGYTVRDDGTISIPDVGQVKLAGMTLEDAENELFQALVAKNVDPAFSLEISEFNSQHVAVGGAVGRAGLVPVTLNPLELGEALAQAGGISAPDAELTAIRLYRNGSLYQMPVSALRDDPQMRHLALLPGDAVFVDKGYDLDRAMTYYRQQIDAISMTRDARSTALAALDAEMSIQRSMLDEQRSTFVSRSDLDAEKRDFVFLAGEVRRQGRVALPYERQASLADILFDQGGFDTRTGDPAQIYVLRAGDEAGREDDVTAWHLDARNIVNMTLATQMQMRPNDIVFIEEQPITKWSRAFEQAFPILINEAVTGGSPTGG